MEHSNRNPELTKQKSLLEYILFIMTVSLVVDDAKM